MTKDIETTEAKIHATFNEALLELLVNQRGISPEPDATAAAIHSLLFYTAQVYDRASAEEWTAQNGKAHPASAVVAHRYYASVENLSATLAEAFERISDLLNEWNSLAQCHAENDGDYAEMCGCPMCACQGGPDAL